jgi:NAD(P)-dependent dehydrogenase (short-subunit alcohol dehydrogenase family)
MSFGSAALTVSLGVGFLMRLCDGRVAIVTGAGRGVGRDYALLLARHGAKVVVNDLGANPDGSGADHGPANEVVDLIRCEGGEAIANGDDVSDWEGARRLVEAAISTFGTLDVLVNNAGILRDRMLVNMSEKEWDDVIKVHLKGMFAPTRHAVEYWKNKAKTSGVPVNARLINTSSTSGLFGNIGQTNYGAAKAGIAAFSIIAARELRRIGVTVNAIVPTATTRLTEGLRELDEHQRETRDPKWIAPVVVYLASEEAHDVTARVFQVGNGVLSVLEGWRRGPQSSPILDPVELGPILRSMARQAKPNVGMNSLELD